MAHAEVAIMTVLRVQEEGTGRLLEAGRAVESSQLEPTLEKASSSIWAVNKQQSVHRQSGLRAALPPQWNCRAVEDTVTPADTVTEEVAFPH